MSEPISTVDASTTQAPITIRTPGEFRAWAISNEREAEEWIASHPTEWASMRPEVERLRRVEGLHDFLTSQLGARYRNCSFSNFECLNDGQRRVVARLQAVDLKSSIVLAGPCGTGKDHLLSALARRACDAGLVVVARNGAEVFADIRASIANNQPEDSVVEPLVNADVFVLSDVSQAGIALTPFQLQTLYRIVDYRYREMKPNWISTNCETREQLADNVGHAIADRLFHGAMIQKCAWDSYRGSSLSRGVQ